MYHNFPANFRIAGGAALLKYDHNHPITSYTSNFPSGTPDYRPEDAGTGDIGSLSYVTGVAISNQQPIPIFRIYVPQKGYRRFHLNSTYKQFSSMADYYYEK